MSSKRILLVDDDELVQLVVEKALDQHELRRAASVTAAKPLVLQWAPHLALLDMKLPGTPGIELLRWLGEHAQSPPVIMLTGNDSIPDVVETMRGGAVDFLTKPFTAQTLRHAIERALSQAEIHQEVHQLRSLQLETNRRSKILGESPQIRKLLEDIPRLAAADVTVLIQGETGTGKELVARAVHSASQRSSGPFVAINCGAIPRDLVESEFFGHHRGAFTGAEAATTGKFKLAHRGTLMLDEIGELPLEAQVKLLRVLEDQEFYPLGNSTVERVDTRVIASTHRNLEQMVEEGTFRRDLFFRLNILCIDVPPLRERKEDILVLSRHFLDLYSRQFKKSFLGFSPGASRRLLRHPWTGNVRELRNVIERIALTCEGPIVTEQHLQILHTQSRNPRTWDRFDLPDEGVDLHELESRLLLQALEKAEGNKTRAARLLHLSPPTYFYRLEKIKSG